MKSERLMIFDLDGTLYDTSAVNYAAYARAFQLYGYTLDYTYYCKVCKGCHYTSFFSALGIKKEEFDKIHNQKKSLYGQYVKKARENRALFDFVERLKDDSYLAVVTTASKRNCNELLQAFGKVSLFDLVLAQEDVQQLKPNPEGFLKAMVHFSMTPEKTVIFEDSMEGIQAARQTGATVFSVVQF